MYKKFPKKTKSIKTTLIAPCGLNCRLCRAYTRNRNSCPGCRCDDIEKSQYCVKCKIKYCSQLSKKSAKFCFNCKEFPCANIKLLDKRYRTKYGLSVIANLEFINEFGIRSFVKNEKEKWKCPNCMELLCMHKDVCISCGYK